MIPQGLHVVGESLPDADIDDWLDALGDALTEEEQAKVRQELATDSELQAITHALDGKFIRPVPGGDLSRNVDILPTGRNLHSFDPFRIPSRYAIVSGAAQADELVQRYVDDSGTLPESVAIVLWGTDNIKTEGTPIAQALRLLGAKPRFDSYGRLAGRRTHATRRARAAAYRRRDDPVGHLP